MKRAPAGPCGAVLGRLQASGPARVRYYVTDHLGSTRAVIDGNGTVQETRDYYPYGLRLPGRTTAEATPALEDYTGHERDSETGLHYAGARYYMAAMGRWTTVDPLADDFPSWSAYTYSYNNPLGFTDPSGRSPKDIIPKGTTAEVQYLERMFTVMRAASPEFDRIYQHLYQSDKEHYISVSSVADNQGELDTGRTTAKGTKVANGEFDISGTEIQIDVDQI